MQHGAFISLPRVHIGTIAEDMEEMVFKGADVGTSRASALVVCMEGISTSYFPANQAIPARSCHFESELHDDMLF